MNRPRTKRTARTKAGKGLDTAFARNRAALLRYLRYRIGTAEDAHDIAQETYLRIMRVPDADLIRRPDAYIFKIAANLAGEFLLKKSSTPETVDLETLIEIGEDGDDFANVAAIEHRSDLSRVRHVLDDMAPLYQSVLMLRKRDGLSHQEIAERLGVSVHTVKVYLKRAVTRLRAEWGEE